MQIVPAVATPLDADHARTALVAAMPGIDRESYTLLLALIWIETGAGGALFNHNAGNISASDKWPGNAWRPPWFTVDASSPPHLVQLHEAMLHGQAPSAFRAYGSMVEGFQDFARVLRSQFQSVLDAARTGDARSFVSALHDSGYSRDYGPAHIPSFQHLQAQLGPLFAGFPSATVAAPAAELVAGGVVLLLGLWAWHKHKSKPRRRRRARAVTL